MLSRYVKKKIPYEYLQSSYLNKEPNDFHRRALQENLRNYFLTTFWLYIRSVPLTIT